MKLRRKILLAVALLVLVFAGWATFKHFQLKHAVAAYHRELRAQGEKLTIAELVPPPATNGPNGAAAVWAAASALGSINVSSMPPIMTIVAPARARVAWAQEPLPFGDIPNVWPLVTADVTGHQQGLTALRTALDCPVIQFDLNYSQGFRCRWPT